MSYTKHRSKSLLIGLLIAIVIGVWFAPISSAQDKITLQVLMHGGAGTDYWERIRSFFDDFEAKHPNIKIEMQPSSASTPEEGLAVRVAGGLSPDLVRLWGVPEAAKAGLIQDISKRFETLPPQRPPN